MFAVLFTLGCTGCMHKPAPEEESTPGEELYIDAKLGFTVIHPLPWERIKVPVSSPSYRQDSVSWDIPAEDETGSMLIRIYPGLTSAAELPDLLVQFIAGKPKHSGGGVEPLQETDSFLHAAGEAVATTISYQEYTERLFAIHGSQNTYILSFSIRTAIFEDQSPLFERIAESFREL